MFRKKCIWSQNIIKFFTYIVSFGQGESRLYIQVHSENAMALKTESSISICNCDNVLKFYQRNEKPLKTLIRICNIGSLIPWSFGQGPKHLCLLCVLDTNVFHAGIDLHSSKLS